MLSLRLFSPGPVRRQPGTGQSLRDLAGLAETTSPASLSFMTPSHAQRDPSVWGVTAVRRPMEVRSPQLL